MLSLIPLLRTLLCLSIVCTCACITPEDSSVTPATLTDPSTMEGASEPRSITFLMRNTTDETLYLVEGDSSTLAWSMTLDGARVQPEKGCAQCVCDEEQCAVCGAWLPDVVELAPGEERSFSWDGVLWGQEPDTIRGAGDCVRSRQASSQGGYRVEVPYSTAFEEVEMGRVLVEPRTQAIDFSYPPQSSEPLVIEF